MKLLNIKTYNMLQVTPQSFINIKPDGSQYLQFTLTLAQLDHTLDSEGAPDIRWFTSVSSRTSPTLRTADALFIDC